MFLLFVLVCPVVLLLRVSSHGRGRAPAAGDEISHSSFLQCSLHRCCSSSRLPRLGCCGTSSRPPLTSTLSRWGRLGWVWVGRGGVGESGCRVSPQLSASGNRTLVCAIQVWSSEAREWSWRLADCVSTLLLQLLALCGVGF